MLEKGNCGVSQVLSSPPLLAAPPVPRSVHLGRLAFASICGAISAFLLFAALVVFATPASKQTSPAAVRSPAAPAAPVAVSTPLVPANDALPAKDPAANDRTRHQTEAETPPAGGPAESAGPITDTELQPGEGSWSEYSLNKLALPAVAAPSTVSSEEAAIESETEPLEMESAESKSDEWDVDHAVVELPVRTEETLKAELREQVPTVSLDAPGDLTERVRRSLFQAATVRGGSTVKEFSLDLVMLQNVVARRPDLEGLPFRWIGACQLGERETVKLADVSTQCRVLSRPLPRKGMKSEEVEEFLLRKQRRAILMLASKREWLDPAATSALEQVFQVQDAPVRVKLVEALTAIPGPEATRTIARRALYDLSPDVRREAIAALTERDASEYQALLVDGLRYPWEAVAWNAAEALGKLASPDLASQLRNLLDAPPPTDPFQREADGPWRVRELVAVQHLRNCMLCHAASNQQDDPVRGFVPVNGRPPARQYYLSKDPSAQFCRADVVYLKQDFSLLQPISRRAHAPLERFDFLVRTRKIDQKEVQRRKRESDSRTPVANPHRDAVVYVLKRLK